MLTARVAAGSGGAGSRGWWLPPRAAVEAHPAVGWRQERPGIVRAGGGREIRRRKPRLHLRRGTVWSARGKVVGGVAWARSMDLPPARANVTHVGVDTGHGRRGPGSACLGGADASGARVGRIGGLDAGLVRSARAWWERGRGVGPTGSQDTGQISGLPGGAYLSVTGGAGPGARREEWKPSRQ